MVLFTPVMPNAGKHQRRTSPRQTLGVNGPQKAPDSKRLDRLYIFYELFLDTWYINKCSVTLILGRKGDEMYFIDFGLVEVHLPDGTLVSTLGNGSYFGGIVHLVLFPFVLFIGDKRTMTIGVHCQRFLQNVYHKS